MHAARAAIRDLPFRHNWKPGLGFELFRLADFYARAARQSLGIEAPQRPEFHTIYVGLEGAGEMIVDFTRVPLGAGRLTIVARGRVQQFVPAPGVDAWMLLVAPEFPMLGGDAREADPLRGAAIFAPTWTIPSIALAASERRELLTLVEQLAAEQARPLDALQPAVLAALLRAVLLRAERIVRAGEGSVPHPAVQNFFTILERDCLHTRSVAHYARAAGISTRRLGELLAAQTGKSTKQVIDDRVALELKRLLAHTDLSVKELADRAGFAEPTNLVKFFRHHTQQTPLEFRATSKFLPSARRPSPRARNRR
jgi:AraC-like DNA-binding protein